MDFNKSIKLGKATGAAIAEAVEAASTHPEFHSYHEGYAVLLEEVDELWAAIKLKPGMRNPEYIKAEATQVAAMAIRFVADLCEV